MTFRVSTFSLFQSASVVMCALLLLWSCAPPPQQDGAMSSGQIVDDSEQVLTAPPPEQPKASTPAPAPDTPTSTPIIPQHIDLPSVQVPAPQTTTTSTTTPIPTTTPTTAGGCFKNPVPSARLSQDFMSTSYVVGAANFHPGEDWGCSVGTPVLAMGPGTVVEQGSYSNWGKIVLVEHTLGDGSKAWSQYAHLEKIMTTNGQVVEAGTQIGTSGGTKELGCTGCSGAHLHLEVRIKKLSASAWPNNQNRAQVLESYADPSEFIAARACP